ncbi:transcriptional repressor CcpN [Planococcus glaciei]|uniref:Helix-turn-helix transcriptional regulator n=1 Tax=Planococcus liqunii TaxID=3058394 RepID=A0ABT8MPT8_9BACL|nr:MULTISPECIES: helix-turn-helix transcriptional regulator [Planococcus]ETP67857.1 transcriptional regulator [Planococcus glaciei CHR43]KOF11878.1 transcriptional repressor CcpN [Planococcus glaciei]MBX0314985.1 helix-turn-helix transcriptional regulator [Planococcus glaciei]MDN7226869.1 helix-turn-helix transcriptional regulator [Planococcus sp. N064]WKA52542.1 helix-turn-helix transcriptional regulator [Planococcus sp. N056]
MSPIELNKRQEEILRIVKGNGPITGEQIADRLHLTRATLRPDLAILTMAGFLDARPRVGYFYSGKKPGQDISDTMNNMKVKDFQSIPVVVREDVSVYDAISQMFLDDVGTLFVVDKNSLLTGVLSRKDLLRTSLGNQDLAAIPVHIIMTRMPNITYCVKNESLIQAAHRLINQQIDALPVVDEQPEGFKVIGRLTKTNITRAFLSLSESHEL